MFNFIIGKRSGRFVENQKLGVCIKCTADFQELLFTGFQLRNHHGGVYIHTQIIEQLFCAPELFLLVDQAKFGCNFPAQENIVGNREIIDHIQFLMHKSNAGLFHLLNGRAGILLAEESDSACIRGDDTRKDIHHCAFPRPIFT